LPFFQNNLILAIDRAADARNFEGRNPFRSNGGPMSLESPRRSSLIGRRKTRRLLNRRRLN